MGAHRPSGVTRWRKSLPIVTGKLGISGVRLESEVQDTEAITKERKLGQANGGAQTTHELVLRVSQPPPGAAQRASRTILLVEDESSVREVTRQVLEAAGFLVIEARTASEARRAFRQDLAEPHLLIADVVLPDRNGRELAEELTCRCPDLKTIFISGYPENVVTRTPGNGGTFYLAKPFSRDSLLGLVRRVLAEGSRGV